MATKRLPATLMLSHKTGKVYILTKYRKHPNGNVTAFEKTDSTNDFAAIVDALPIDKAHRDAVLAAVGVARKADLEAQAAVATAVEDVQLDGEDNPGV